MSNRTSPPSTRRERALAHVRARMKRHGSPRLQMMALLTVTGGAGFAAAYALLHLGVHAMAVRYPLAVLFAYAVFLLVLRLWLGTMMRRGRSRDWDVDLPDLSTGSGGSGGGGIGGGGGSSPRFGGGGGFTGGGAGGSWAGAGSPAAPLPVVGPIPVAAPVSASPEGSLQGVAGGGSISRGGGSGPGGGFKLPSLDVDDDSGVVIAIVLLLLAAAALVMAAGYIVMIAPALLAELVVDGIVVAGLYRRVREIDDARWLRTAVRKTWIPALLVAAMLGGVGYGVQRAIPRARSVGDVWRAASSPDEGVGPVSAPGVKAMERKPVSTDR